jgi:hypothetical protein
MAITTNSLAILSSLYPSASDMGRVLTVGRLGLYAPEVFLREVRARWGRKPELGNEPVPKYFDELLGQCGVAEVSALDGSDYEGAHLVHDLNQPVPDSWTESFDTIVDAGTLEHIFQAVQALGSLMKMVKVGGRLLLFDMPTNNLSGHGFYQFSPIFFSETLSPAYGFTLDALLVGEDTPFEAPREITQAMLKAGRRIELAGDKPCFIYVAATKVAPFPGFQTPAIQPDYQVRWNQKETAPPPLPSAARMLKLKLAELSPAYFRFSHLRNQRRALTANQLSRFATWRKDNDSNR